MKKVDKVLIIEFGIKKIENVRTILISERFDVVYADNFLDILDSITKNRSSVIVLSDFRGREHTAGYIRMFKKAMDLKNIIVLSNTTTDIETKCFYTANGAYSTVDNCNPYILKSTIDALLDTDNQKQKKIDTNQITAFIRNTFNSQIDHCEVLSQNTGVSERTINKILKEETGKTVWEWLTEYRIKMSTRLILTEQYSLKTISSMIGFRSPQGFIKLFYREFGMPPSKFRESRLDNSLN